MTIIIESGCNYPIYPGANRPDIEVGVYKDMLVLTQRQLGVLHSIYVKLKLVKVLVSAMENVRALNVERIERSINYGD